MTGSTRGDHVRTAPADAGQDVRALRVGTDRTDITPRHPVPLAGFAARADLGNASTVLSPLQLRTLAFADPASGERVVFCSADLLWWGDDLAAEVRENVGGHYGLRPDAVVLHATHNHSGPQPSRRYTDLLGVPDDAYLDQLRQATLDSVGRALADVAPVRAEQSSAPSGMVVDRRWARSAGAVPPVRVDDEVTVVCFRRDDRPVAFLVHFACHPVVHHENAVTADFPGAAMTALESRYPGAVAAFAQGCCGDVNPARYDADGGYRSGAQPEVDAMGAELADAVESALADAPVPLGPPRVGSDSHVVELPLQPPPAPAELHERATASGVEGQWARLLLNDPSRISDTLPVRFTRVRLTTDLDLLGLGAEPVSAYGLFVKDRSGGATLPLGYTNGMAGYLVTARQLAEGGYEPAIAPYYFGMPATLRPEAEAKLCAALAGDLATAGNPSSRTQSATEMRNV